MCAMWALVPPALGLNLVFLMWDTMLNGVKVVNLHYFIYTMYMDTLILLFAVDALVALCQGVLLSPLGM